MIICAHNFYLNVSEQLYLTPTSVGNSFTQECLWKCHFSPQIISDEIVTLETSKVFHIGIRLTLQLRVTTILSDDL
jgi:hypothetical protein